MQPQQHMDQQLNAHQKEIRDLLSQRTAEIYSRKKDELEIYESFRKNIRDREAFNQDIKNIQLNDNIRIWRTNKAIEDDCKERLR